MNPTPLFCLFLMSLSGPLAPALDLAPTFSPDVIAEAPGQRPDPERHAGEIATFAMADTAKGGIVFTGSSSIRLWPDLQGDFPDLPVVNRGFGGSVANDIIVHFDDIIANAEPKLLVTYTGSNDLHKGLTVEEAFEDYAKFLKMSRERFPDIRVVLTSVKVSPKRAAEVPRVHELNKLLENWAKETDWIRYVDCTSGLTDEKGDFVTVHFSDDNLHLSESGYQQWQAILEPVIREEWEKVK